MRTYKVISPITHAVGVLIKAKIVADPSLFERLRAAVDLGKTYFQGVLNGTKHTSVRRLEIICKLCDIELHANLKGVTRAILAPAKPEQKTFENIQQPPTLNKAMSLSDVANENHNELQKAIARIEELERIVKAQGMQNRLLSQKVDNIAVMQHQTLVALSKHVKEGGHNASIIAAR